MWTTEPTAMWQLLSECYNQAQPSNALYTGSAGMADELPRFDRLPSHQSEALLRQAWQQLDKRHRFGIIPRVCRSWYLLSIPTFTSLKLSYLSEESVQQLALWLRHHGSALRRLSLELVPMRSKDCLPCEELASAIQSCSALVDLQLTYWHADAAELLDLQHLQKLSSVKLSSPTSPASSAQKFLKSLPPHLKSLDMHHTCLSLREYDIHQIFSRLPVLRRLDARRTGLPFGYLASCPNLPPLQELKLDMAGFGDDMADLAKLPCSFLDVAIEPEEMEESVAWCTSQQGKRCLGKLIYRHVLVRNGPCGWYCCGPPVVSCCASMLGNSSCYKPEGPHSETAWY